MDDISRNLELIRLASRYNVRKDSDGTSYSVYDSQSSMTAFYNISDREWTYGISDMYNSSEDFVEISLDDFNSLINFTKLMTGSQD